MMTPILQVIDKSTKKAVESINFDMDFATEKDFTFTLFNSHPEDEIHDVRLLTNMTSESYQVINSPKFIGPGKSADFRIRIFKEGITKNENLSEDRRTARRLGEFTYKRKSQVF